MLCPENSTSWVMAGSRSPLPSSLPLTHFRTVTQEPYLDPPRGPGLLSVQPCPQRHPDGARSVLVCPSLGSNSISLRSWEPLSFSPASVAEPWTLAITPSSLGRGEEKGTSLRAWCYAGCLICSFRSVLVVALGGGCCHPCAREGERAHGTESLSHRLHRRGYTLQCPAPPLKVTPDGLGLGPVGVSVFWIPHSHGVVPRIHRVAHNIRNLLEGSPL